MKALDGHNALYMFRVKKYLRASADQVIISLLPAPRDSTIENSVAAVKWPLLRWHNQNRAALQKVATSSGGRPADVCPGARPGDQPLGFPSHWAQAAEAMARAGAHPRLNHVVCPFESLP